MHPAGGHALEIAKPSTAHRLYTRSTPPVLGSLQLCISQTPGQKDIILRTQILCSLWPGPFVPTPAHHEGHLWRRKGGIQCVEKNSDAQLPESLILLACLPLAWPSFFCESSAVASHAWPDLASSACPSRSLPRALILPGSCKVPCGGAHSAGGGMGTCEGSPTPHTIPLACPSLTSRSGYIHSSVPSRFNRGERLFF